MLDSGFTEEKLNREYQAGLSQEKVRLSRILAVMSFVMTVCFIPLDVLAIPSALQEVLVVRLVLCLTAIGLFVATLHRSFCKIYPWVVSLTFLVMGLGINAMIYMAGPTDRALDTYYGGLLLITVALYAMTYFSLWLSISLSLTMILGYLVVAVVVHDYNTGENYVVLVANLFFFISVTVACIVGRSTRDRYSRENYILRHSLEKDIEMKEEEARRASYLAEHDALTGLPNRVSFTQKAGRIIDQAGQDGGFVACLFIDLNDFKPINDRYGHAVGDRALKEIARRMRQWLRPNAIIARFGGDEFVACVRLEQNNYEQDLQSLVNKMHSLIAIPVQTRHLGFSLSASIGVALYPRDGTNLESLLALADRKMYEKKRV